MSHEITVPAAVVANLGGVDGSPSTPNGSVQFDHAGDFGGATHASISADGYLEVAGDRAGGAATTGDIRFARDSSGYFRAYSGSDDLLFWGDYSYDATADYIAGSAIQLFGYGEPAANVFTEVYAYAGSLLEFGVGQNGSAAAAGLRVIGNKNWTTAPTMSFVQTWYNVLFGSNGPRFTTGMVDPFKGGRGYIQCDDIIDAASGPPDFGWRLSSRNPDHHPILELPDGTSYDLVAGGSGEEVAYLTITADTAAGFNVDGVGVLSSHSSGGTVTIREMVPPTAGKAKRVVITNNNGDGATLVLKHDNGFTAAYGFDLAGFADLVINQRESYVAFYDHDRSRWALAKGSA